MLRLYKDEWPGNKWPAIEIYPVDKACFLAILTYLSQTYTFAWPQIVDSSDSCTTFFMINDSVALMLLDTWTFSIAFGLEPVRDEVFADLSALPPDYFNL